MIISRFRPTITLTYRHRATFNPLTVRLLMVQFALIEYFMSLMSILNEVEIVILKLFKLATFPLFLPDVRTPSTGPGLLYPLHIQPKPLSNR